MDDWVSKEYWQTLRFSKELYGLKIEDAGTIAKPRLRISIYSRKPLVAKEIELLKREIIWRFELNADLKEFNELAKRDMCFYPIFKKWMGMRTSSQYNLYELLIIAIVLQNATVRRSVQMLDALLGKCGTVLKFDGMELYAMWLPEDLEKVSEQELRNLKVGYRAKFIKRLSQDFAKDKINELKLRGMNEEGTEKELMKLYGVGPETARILLFEVFHHYDVFDHIAPWQQKIYSRLFYNKRLVTVNKIRDDIKKRYGR